MVIGSASSATAGKLLLIGLSAENWYRMTHGNPIQMTRATHGVAIPADLTIIIFGGETEAAMQADIHVLSGMLSLERGRPDDAEPSFRRAIALSKIVADSVRPSTGRPLVDLFG